MTTIQRNTRFFTLQIKGCMREKLIHSKTLMSKEINNRNVILLYIVIISRPNYIIIYLFLSYEFSFVFEENSAILLWFILSKYRACFPNESQGCALRYKEVSYMSRDSTGSGPLVKQEGWTQPKGVPFFFIFPCA